MVVPFGFSTVTFRPPMDAISSAAGAVAWTHGDFHPDQVATERTTGETRLMDLDELALREPAVDLSSWIADQLVVELVAEGRPEEADVTRLAAPLLDAYGLAGGVVPDPDRLASHVALHLVHRAAGACRRLEQGAEDTAARLLQAARRIAPAGSVFA